MYRLPNDNNTTKFVKDVSPLWNFCLLAVFISSINTLFLVLCLVLFLLTAVLLLKLTCGMRICDQKYLYCYCFFSPFVSEELSPLT